MICLHRLRFARLTPDIALLEARWNARPDWPQRPGYINSHIISLVQRRTDALSRIRRLTMDPTLLVMAHHDRSTDELTVVDGIGQSHTEHSPSSLLDLVPSLDHPITEIITANHGALQYNR